ncbi:acyl-CoA thioesterase [Caulobacter sp. NIBR2454]|uniref:acyl-CoA thioesterase n=1 Tax=Caulobacter sp. NIBR2454 TaxID=3015996 RepID=UPI0022B6AF09|nr:thioesterase family protein [Caulobacter sp. NIBR2454]
MSRAFEAPAGAFSLLVTASESDIDANGHVNNVVYLRWAQDIAIAHWESKTTPEERAPWTWVARRHEIDYRRELLPGETATVRTWVGELKGPRFERYVRIDGPDGEMCAQSRTDWALVNVASRRPARVPDWMVERFKL